MLNNIIGISCRHFGNNLNINSISTVRRFSHLSQSNVCVIIVSFNYLLIDLIISY